MQALCACDVALQNST